MLDKDKILVGKIVAPQGIKGQFRVHTYTADPMDFQKFKVQSPLFKDNQFHVIRRLNPSSDVIVAQIDGINDRTAAENIVGTELYINRDSLPAVGADEYYIADLVGMKVIDANGTEFKVVDVKNFGAGDILELDNGEMMSFAGATVDLENKTIKLQ